MIQFNDTTKFQPQRENNSMSEYILKLGIRGPSSVRMAERK
jgi:hypothetical protein